MPTSSSTADNQPTGNANVLAATGGVCLSVFINTAFDLIFFFYLQAAQDPSLSTKSSDDSQVAGTKGKKVNPSVLAASVCVSG